VSQKNSASTVGRPAFFGTVVRVFRREACSVQECSEHLIAFSTEHGLGFWLLLAPRLREWAMALEGHHEEGIAQMCQSLALTREVGVNIGWSSRLCTLAEAYRTAAESRTR